HFYINRPPPPSTSTLSLHDALPICMGSCHSGTSTAMSDLTPRLYLASPLITDVELFAPQLEAACKVGDIAAVLLRLAASDERARSEEHTSELQSRENLVCRLLLEKK